MKALLLFPPDFNMIRSNVPSIVDQETGFYPPIGLLSVATYSLTHSSHDIKVIDTHAQRMSYDQIEQKIRELNPDLVGIQALTFSLCDVLLTAKRVKKANPDIKVVLGGPHVYLFPEETLNFPEVDFIVLGEGEKIFCELLNILEQGGDLSRLKGIGYKEGERSLVFPPDPFLTDLDSLPHPRRDLLPIRNYSSILSKGSCVTTLISSRGCPFQCIFCDRPHLGKKFRHHSARYVVDEMKICRDLGIEEIIFYDDTMTINRDRVMEICRLLKEEKINLMWDVRAHINTVDKDLLREMASAGCIRIHYGIESGNQRVVDVLRKNIRLDRVKEVFRETKRVGIETLGYFIIGNPTETREEIRDTIRFAREIDPDYVHLSVMMPFPGTEIYRLGLEKGILPHDYWKQFAATPDPSFIPMVWEENFSQEELNEMLIKAYKDFYKRPGYIIKRLLKMRSWKEVCHKVKAGIRLLKL
jgi:anaerobic magnesium-protoporphyrin IX monomethyl ester cyclase